MEQVTPPAEVSTRLMAAADVEAVAALEAIAFSSPWPADTFLDLIGRPTAELWVLDHRGTGLVGYAVLWCILDQSELANIAIQPEFRGRGWGAHLMRHLIEVARGRGIETMYLEVRVSNFQAVRLYEGFGFIEVGRRQAYYDHPREDARVMMVRL